LAWFGISSSDFFWRAGGNGPNLIPGTARRRQAVRFIFCLRFAAAKGCRFHPSRKPGFEPIEIPRRKSIAKTFRPNRYL
jgi:hypothetical protein